MDHSLPLLVSDSGAASEVAGPAALTFKTGNEIDLSHKLIRLVEDQTLRAKLGHEGSRRVRESFGLEEMIKGYVRVYEQGISA